MVTLTPKFYPLQVVPFPEDDDELDALSEEKMRILLGDEGRGMSEEDMRVKLRLRMLGAE